MWVKDDVKKHKKGLDDKQKGKWVRIANGILSSCMKKGKKEEECAASAIRIANSMVGVKANEEVLSFNDDFISLADIKIRTELFDKRLHLIAPVVMLVEGVHNGLLYLEEDLKTIPESWNGRPIVIAHPKKDGEPVSVNSSPELAERTKIGTIFNSIYLDKKLKAEIWIDVEKAMKIAPDILTSINNGKSLEISTGLWSEEEEKEGEFEGETYYAIARHYKPDHLALLPNEKGACSWKDGCGVRANETEVVDGELSLHCIMDKLYQMMNVPSNPNDMYSQPSKRLKDVYFDYFTYEDKDNLLYKQGYKVSKKGEITLKGDPEQVKKLVSYEVAEQNLNLSKHFIRRDNVDKKQKIEFIMNTKQMEYKPEQAGILEAMSDADLDLHYKIAEKFRNCKSCNGEIKINEDKLKEDPIVKPSPKTVQEYVKDAPSVIKDLIINGVRMHNERKATLVKALISNKKNTFSQEKLDGMPIDELESLIALAQVDVDFSGQGGSSYVGTLKDNERQSDGSGVPDAPEMKWGSASNKK